jgi:hypothetical protein
MDGKRPIRLVLEIEPGADPIQGVVLEPSHDAGAFRGWLALAALIDALAHEPPVEDTDHGW